MFSTDDARALTSANGEVLDNNGEKIGKVGQVYLDDQTGEPAWVTVKTGLFGGGESFVPLAEAAMTGDDVTVPYEKSKVKDAPRIEDEDGRLSVEEEDDLYRYYGLTSPKGGYSEGQQDQQVGGDRSRDDADRNRDQNREQSGVANPAGHDTSGPDTDGAMTRSEEQLRVGTTSEVTGRARLRKYIVTENVTKTVPVSHEEVRVERVPITDENRGDAMSGGDLTEEDHEVELKGERVVVEKDVVPVERVQVGTETVTEEQTVSEEVRREQIDTEGLEGHTDGRDQGV